jgi:GNAT superfamily N-acetyltransferase
VALAKKKSALTTLSNPLDESLVVEVELSPDDIRHLEDSIYGFNVKSTGISDGRLFGLFLRDAGGVAIGGVHGWTWAKTCCVRILFVPAHLRNQGHGTKLMRAVEEEARARGCEQIMLETFEFQAPKFYLRLGFEIIGRVPNYVHGHDSIIMAKYLIGGGSHIRQK